MQYLIWQEAATQNHVFYWGPQHGNRYCDFRRTSLKYVQDCKVFPVECMAKQHKPVIRKAKMKGVQTFKSRSYEKNKIVEPQEPDTREQFNNRIKRGV